MRRKTPVLIFIFLIQFVLIRSSETEKSLFDDLPLNGAYSPEATAADAEDRKSVEKSQLSPTQNEREEIDSNKVLQQRSGDSNSLFDSMVNQGALISKEHIFESKTQKRGIFAKSSDLDRSPNGELRFQIEIQRQNPTAEFNLKNFHPNQIPSILQSVAHGESPLVQKPSLHVVPPLVRVPVVQGNPVQVPTASRLYGTPVIPTPARTQYNAPRPASDSTLIIYGTPVPNLKKPEPVPEVHNHFYPTRQEVRNTHYYSRGRPSLRAGTFSGVESRTQIPIITGRPGDRGYGPATGNENVEFTTAAPQVTLPTTTSAPFIPTAGPPVSEEDYDYDSLQPTSARKEFGARTGKVKFNEPNTYRIPSLDSKSHYDQRQPFDTYGPHPHSTYGPPQVQDPAPPPPPSYGPPPKDVPVPPAPSASSTTSISFQTIPIQTVQTQLVTVPQVTVSSSSTSEVDSDGNSRPQSPGRPQTPPSITYGQPLGESPARGGLPSGGLFTNDQLALIISASRGLGDESLYEDDPLSLITGSQRGVGNVLNFNSDLEGGLQFPIAGRNRFGVNQASLLGSPVQLPVRTLRGRDGGLQQDQLVSLLAYQQRLGGLRYADQASIGGFRYSPDLQLLRGTRNGPVLTGDAIDALDQILREQRLRGAVNDLRGRLNHEGRSADRARRNYRSLFYKGALLLGALTLLPAVATPLAAAASGVSTPHFLLPLAAGRRRRSLVQVELEKNPFKICRNKLKSLSPTDANRRLADYLNCISNTTDSASSESLFDSMPFNSGFVPVEIRAELQKYVSPSDIMKNSECLQKRFCETMVEIQKLPNAEAFHFLYAAFTKGIETNPWIKEAMTARRSKSCQAFYCYEDYEKKKKNPLLLSEYSPPP